MSNTQDALRKLCDQLDAMKRRMRHTPGTGQNHSYLLHEDVAACVEEARSALSAAPASEQQPAASMPAITDEEMQAFKRFCECCEDSDADGHDVPKEMMKRLAVIGLVRPSGFGRHETTLFGDALLAQQAADSSADRKDAERLEIKVCCIGNTPDEIFICETRGKITVAGLQEIEAALHEEWKEDSGTFHGEGEYTFKASYNKAERGEYGVICVPAYWYFEEVAFKPYEDAAIAAQSQPSEKGGVK